MATTTRNLSVMPHAQAKVLVMDNGSVVLRSYYTGVATLTAEGWLIIHGLYSATTRRHIGCFVKEYANLDYQTAKMLYNNCLMYNIHTGEVTSIC